MTESDPNTTPRADGPGTEGPATEPGEGGTESHPDRPAEGADAPHAAADAAAEEAAAAESLEQAVAGEADRLTEEVARLEAENAKLKDQLLRALAEQENTRRRAERDREDAARYAIAKFAGDLLDPADNLRRAVEAAPSDAQDEALKTLLDGVLATERALLAAFERHGLTRIDPQPGEKFDPTWHEAMFEMPAAQHPPGSIAQVMQPGYALNGRLVRPARVGVAKGEPPQKVDTSA